MPEDYGRKVRQLLPSNFERMDEVIKDKLYSDANVEQASLPGFAWHMVGSKATEAVHDVMDCDVFELLARAWCTARELHEYTNETKYPPGKESTLCLGEHKLATSVHPILNVTIGPIECAPLRFTLELAAEFRSAELSIRDGHIVAIGAGDCSVSAQLKYGDVKLHDTLKSTNVKLSKPLELHAPAWPSRDRSRIRLMSRSAPDVEARR